MDNALYGESNLMPKQILQIKDFSGGLNTLRDPADIADNELQVIENLRI